MRVRPADARGRDPRAAAGGASHVLVVAEPRLVVGVEDLADELAATAHARLLEDAFEVLLNCVGGNAEAGGDLRCRVPWAEDPRGWEQTGTWRSCPGESNGEAGPTPATSGDGGPHGSCAVAR